MFTETTMLNIVPNYTAIFTRERRSEPIAARLETGQQGTTQLNLRTISWGYFDHFPPLTLHLTLYSRRFQIHSYTAAMSRKYNVTLGRRTEAYCFLWENLKQRDHFEDKEVKLGDNIKIHFNLLKSNDIYIYICRNAALTSRSYILFMYSTNTHTEYFKHAA